MNEQDLREANECLRRELAEVREDRNQLHKMLCSMVPLEEVQPTADDLKEMRDRNVTIVDLLNDPRFSELEPTNGACVKDKAKVKLS